MTTTQSTESITTEVSTADLGALVAKVMSQIEQGKGKVSLSEAIGSVLNGEIAKDDTPVPIPTVPEITDAQREALASFADIYGKVAPKVARLLTPAEQKAIVEERATLDVILGLAKTRKDVSIRETLANHLDRKAEKDGLANESTEKDRSGHYALKQDEPVEGTDKKISRSVSEPKPVITGASLYALFEEGVLTRAEYLAVTREPAVTRVFDEDKARAAIKKNNDLLFKIAKATQQPAKTTTIKVQPFRG